MDFFPNDLIIRRKKDFFSYRSGEILVLRIRECCRMTPKEGKSGADLPVNPVRAMILAKGILTKGKKIYAHPFFSLIFSFVWVADPIGDDVL